MAAVVPENYNDIYGQQHLDENPEMIAEALLRMENELEKIPNDRKVAWNRAQTECPDLVGNSHKIMFLRCEVFQSDLAAGRLVRFWEAKIDLFGDTAFKPITIDNYFKGETLTSLEAVRLIPEKDASRRGILFIDPSKIDTTKCDRELYRKANFYVTMAALEDETVQKKGIIVLFYPPNAELAKFDKILLKKVLGSAQGTMPLRIGAFHVCQPPSFSKFLLPVFKLLMGARLRKRIKFHYGTNEDVVSKLEKYELSVNVLPVELGGKIVLNQAKWFEARRARGL